MYDWIYKFKWKWWQLKTKYFYRLFLGSIGNRSTICRPMYLAHLENMYFGSHVRIREFARLETIVEYNDQKFSPTLKVGNDVGFEQGLHMVCAESIVIGSDVTVSAYVMIMDCGHNYDDIKTNVINQTLSTLPVVIGDGCFIGLGARIMPGTHLGQHCSVGSNAVVTGGAWKDYSVLVGCPAYCVKRYDVTQGIWKKTDKKGEFLDECRQN